MHVRCEMSAACRKDAVELVRLRAVISKRDDDDKVRNARDELVSADRVKDAEELARRQAVIRKLEGDVKVLTARVSAYGRRASEHRWEQRGHVVELDRLRDEHGRRIEQATNEFNDKFNALSQLSRQRLDSVMQQHGVALAAACVVVRQLLGELADGARSDLDAIRAQCDRDAAVAAELRLDNGRLGLGFRV
jgi:hypothetical protein